ncbi:MAG: serine/threonine protein kinase [Deltaproteobacteria bacterium]|nr:serine/threonine protein kinase [Deltaproteobacteria bacterium]
MPIHPGDVLAGYRVIQLLGRGGMGEIWSAADANGRRQVAIKVLLPRAAHKPQLVRRFEREAQAVASIDSPYVCKLISCEKSESGAHLLVFEKLDGESLGQRLKREQYLPFAEVGPIVDDVLQGLCAAHAAGVVHRDLKPANVFLEWTRDPQRPERAKILDFGISKLTRPEEGGRREPTLTDLDATLGSFAYMAPEQVHGSARADARADIYAVGALAFRALAGRLPFEGTSAGMILALKVDRDAPSLADVTGDRWPAGLERFLGKALQRPRDARFASAREALEAWRQIQPAALSRRAPAAGQASLADEVSTETDVDEGSQTEVSGSRWDVQVAAPPGGRGAQ